MRLESSRTVRSSSPRRSTPAPATAFRTRRAVRRDRGGGMTRVLILTASVGEGHDLPARTLTAQLHAESPETRVVVEDGLAAMGRLLVAVADDGIRAVTDRRQWVFDVSYGMFARFPPARAASRELLARVAAPRLRALVEAVEPDVVVSVYPVTTEVLGWMRRRRMLAVPACAAITDLSSLRYWAAPGIDLH